MCTSTVEVLWFDDDEARQDVYDLLADTGGAGGSVYFAEGRNWFVTDGAEVMVGAAPERPVATPTPTPGTSSSATGTGEGGASGPSPSERLPRCARPHPHIRRLVH
jgi:hypothetical protein